jgi:hypothetical protein
MRAKNLKVLERTLETTVAALLLLTAGVASAAVTLTAQSTITTLPDGQSVPMWGLFCGSAAAVAPNGGTCTTQTGAAQSGTAWQPPLIRVQAGATLDIALTNNLKVPTSLVIVGQLGGGLGNAPTRTPSPVHPPQSVTWPIAGDATGPQFTPPAQAARVRSFGTEVAPGGTTTLTWTALKPGTYLLESGTHPSIQGPMGLYGVVVVTDTTVTPNRAYAGVSYDADVPLLLSEIDPVQNAAVDAAVNNPSFSETTVWSGAPGACGDVTQPITAHTCYPPAVNYSPLYYLINGVSFDRSNPTSSALAVPATATSGNVLLRFVNVGLRMHVPSVVGLDMKLIAEDGNVQPDVALALANGLTPQPKAQTEVFLAAGKTYDIVVTPPVAAGSFTAAAFPVFDRELSLSTNNQRDGGMQAYLQVAGGALPGSTLSATARPDSYYLVSGNTLAVAESAKGVMANDTGVYGVQVQTPPANGTVTLNPDGTFTYVPNSGTTSDSFTYCGNGAISGALCTTVTLAQCTGTCLGGPPTANGDSYTSNIASRLQISPPGVLANDSDPSGLALTAALVGTATGGTVTLNADGSFVATPTTPPVGAATASVTFQYNAVNAQHTASTTPATVTVTFKGGSGLAVAVKDAPTGAPITDYRWIIEEDRTFRIDPATQTNNGATAPVPSLGTNFHTSYMPVVAQGCVGTVACEAGQTVLGVPAVCDQGNGICHTDATQQVSVDPSQVALDPTKRYYISILPGDGANGFISGAGAPVDLGNGQSRPFDIALDCGTYAPGAPNWIPGTGTCGHGMGGAPISAGQASVNVALEETPLPTAKIAVFVFEDDRPLNGENDAGGGVDVLAPNEPGLGGFEITLFDQAGGLGDPTGQITYDMFNMPVSNALAGTIDPATHQDACPISKKSDGIVGMIVTCPKYEADGTTLSPLAGQAVIANMYPGLYEVVATPAAERIARGEEWLQTNTLDGTKPLEAFIKPGEPAYFQEFGPAGYHVAIGFANPKIINDRKAEVCANQPCNNSVTGRVTTTRMSRMPDERLYSSGSYDANSYTQCYVSLGDPDDEDFAFTKCNADGTFTLSGLPDGSWRITVFDQWNDLLVDGLSTPVALHGGQALNMGDVGMQQWRANLYTRTFFDQNGDGVSQDSEPGLSLVSTNIRYRDGSYAFFNSTDLNGYAGFNEVFPFMNWLVVDADSTRYKQTGVHVVYDAGGPADGTPGGGTSTIADHLANTLESSTAHLPADLRFPGSVYCNDADCNDRSGTNPSTGRVDPPWVTTEGWQGLLGQASFIEFGKAPFATGENGGIRGEVNYASTRPFDDPALLLHLSWAPNVPNVTVNLYKEGSAPDGTQSLTLIDTTKTSSWDDWAQGFHPNANGTTQIPNMSCPGQETTSPFYYTLQNSTQWLDPATPIPYNSRFKCYDGWAMLNQVQPAPYDGMYQFPSVTSRNPATGAPTGTNCTACIANPVDGRSMLPPGKYVVEVIVPPGYELVKEEDKNILIGDNYIAPVSQQFAGLGNIFILPDQAAMNAAYNPYNPLNPTTDLGAKPRHEGDTGSVESFWPCVGAKRVVPDYLSLFPGAQETAPFAGASRNLCDRKEVTLTDQTTALVKFYIFSSTHIAAHYTGVITDDYASEFDPFSPSFGEKFAVPNLPISIKDWNGVEVARTYSDQWGVFNGLNYSTWEVNPPNPTGYAPTMMVVCMNDPGPIPDPAHPGQTMTDPLYNAAYSNFCYELSFMPGQTQYMDTPVVPTMAFADGYNLPDCAYPDTTPAIKSVTGDSSGGGAGPWVSVPTHILTITALGDQLVPNHAYSGPQSTTSPFNQKFITRHYGFGATQGSGSVTIAGVDAPVVSWSDTQIQVRVPNLSATESTCTIQQRGVGAATRCGQLVIAAGNGKKSIDAVTVTIGGKAPTYVNGENGNNTAIQTAIDHATPGDLIIVGPGIYNEMLLMWKPVRLQGVGAASVTLNANAHPAGKLLEPWRRQVNCLFGLALNGQPIGAGNPYDPTGTYTCTVPTVASNPMQIDRVPLEGIIGWDTTTNGNLAELLAEPTLMGAYEGAGITVLGKGVRIPAGATDIFGSGAEAAFPANTRLLASGNADCNDFPSNFLCNPSRIDGMTITNSSQGGGGIFLHGWNHYLEIANNRIYANAGTLSGGITVGQGEFPDPNLYGTADYDPLLAPAGFTGVPGTQAPFYLQHHVSVHNNSITSNSSIGDELYSATPSAAGGITFCTGSDYYRFNYNWVCGNLSTGDGGGVVHSGFSYNGTISNNWIIFNQSNNPTIPTHGGGLAVLAAAPDRTLPSGIECGSTNDLDCPPGLSDGTGPGLVINANLIMGNTAESGSGGGIRLQGVNGTEVARFPTLPNQWYDVTVTNNIIANNVAGWDGGGVSMQDALRVNFINNTTIANDATASAGVLFNTIGAANASVPPPGCNPQPDPTLPQDPSCIAPVTTSTNQAAGLVTMRNSPNLVASMPATVTCPAGYYPTTTNGECRLVSLPLLKNDVFWQNRAFHITVGSYDPSVQQNVVMLVPTLNQATTGDCPNGASYWDIGVRGDTGPSDHGSGFTLHPTYSVLTDASDYTGANNLGGNPAVVHKYCNGSRLPPENGGLGFAVPPGVADATVPNPLFNLTPAATVDEGNNWINMSYGPLSLVNASILAGMPGYGVPLGNYAITTGSPAMDAGTSSGAPSTDFFGTPRPQGSGFDIGAVEVVAVSVPPPSIPVLAVLDTFDRPNANTLNAGAPAGVAWTQTLALGAAALRVNGNQTTSVSFFGLAPVGYWNGSSNVFGARQAAAFTFASVPANNTALMMKATGAANAAGYQANFIRVDYMTTGGGTIAIQTTTDNGVTYTTAGTPLTGFGDFANGDTLTAMVDQTGTVYVWKTTTANVTTFIGSQALPANALWTTGGGRIGMQLNTFGSRVDNFAGGTVP